MLRLFDPVSIATELTFFEKKTWLNDKKLYIYFQFM